MVNRKAKNKTMKELKTLGFTISAAIFISSCGGENTSSNVKAPGAEESTKSKVLEAGAALLQDKTPINKINMYLNGFHFYNGNMGAQMEVQHYVSQLNEDLHQALMYDGNDEN